MQNIPNYTFLAWLSKKDCESLQRFQDVIAELIMVEIIAINERERKWKERSTGKKNEARGGKGKPRTHQEMR